MTGRAQGNVHDRTAAWVDPTAEGSGSTQVIGDVGASGDATEEMPRADGHRRG